MARTIHRTGQALKDYLLLMASLPTLRAEDQAELLKRMRAGDSASMRELVEAYLPKVLLWVAPRRGEGYSFQELIALGNSALIEGLQQYRGDAAGLEEKACQFVHDALDTALKLQS